MFDIHAIEKGASSDKTIVFTFQAMADEDLEGWLSVMEGQTKITRPQIASRTEMQSQLDWIDQYELEFRLIPRFPPLDELDDAGIDFVKKCIVIIERRGLHEQGLYRIVGMQSKVNSLVSAHFGMF